jgi:hypothetical protein
MALLNCLRVPRQFQRFRRRGEESEGDYLLKLIFLGLLVFAGFRCLAVELFRRELFPYHISFGSNPQRDIFASLYEGEERQRVTPLS